MTATDSTIDTCNALLRGEISAVETYTQAIQKFDATSTDMALERIRADHDDSAAELSKFVSACGCESSTGSGVWGGFVAAIEGAATLIGESPALSILQTGEKHGITEYENALDNPDVSSEAKQLIRAKLLPVLSNHLLELQQRKQLAA